VGKDLQWLFFLVCVGLACQREVIYGRAYKEEEGGDEKERPPVHSIIGLGKTNNKAGTPSHSRMA